MKLLVRLCSALLVIGLIPVVIPVPALAGTRPVVSGLSAHKRAYWGDSLITVHGRNFTHVVRVMFGKKRGHAMHVRSTHTLTVRTPVHKYGTVHVRVVTATGTSTKTTANRFTFTRPTMNSRIQGGLTGRQEQRISAHVRRVHHGVHTAARSRRWTAAMGATAAARARSWLGLPYSWAGGNGSGPTRGVCAHNGGDMDCHIVGFDCSGLTQYSWWPYKHLVHYAASQHSGAGRFHPTIAELMPGDLVFFSGYIANGIGHTAVYEGNGNVIQAEQSGTRVMRSRLVDVIAHSGRYRGATRPLSTGRQAAGPHLTSVTTQVSLKGGYVTVRGSGLTGTTSVAYAGRRIYSFTRRTSTELVFHVPAHRAGAMSVYVSNAWGTVRRTVTYVGAPVSTALSPTSGPATGGTKVVVSGHNLATVSRVTLGSTSVRFSHLTAGRLQITMPAHAAGSVTVTLYSRFGTSNRRVFSYRAVPPATSSAPPSTTPPATTAPPTTAPPPTTPPPTSEPPTSTDPPTDEPPGSTDPPSDPTSSDASTSGDPLSTVATG